MQCNIIYVYRRSRNRKRMVFIICFERKFPTFSCSLNRSRVRGDRAKGKQKKKKRTIRRGCRVRLQRTTETPLPRIACLVCRGGDNEPWIRNPYKCVRQPRDSIINTSIVHCIQMRQFLFLFFFFFLFRFVFLSTPCRSGGRGGFHVLFSCGYE